MYYRTNSKLPILRNNAGEKLYPVCSWEKNQHKIYNALTRAQNREYDYCTGNLELTKEEANKLFEEVELLNYLCGVIDHRHYKGIVYATWKDREKLREYIMAYDIRH